MTYRNKEMQLGNKMSSRELGMELQAPTCKFHPLKWRQKQEFEVSLGNLKKIEEEGEEEATVIAGITDKLV